MEIILSFATLLFIAAAIVFFVIGIINAIRKQSVLKMMLTSGGLFILGIASFLTFAIMNTDFEESPVASTGNSEPQTTELYKERQEEEEASEEESEEPTTETVAAEESEADALEEEIEEPVEEEFDPSDYQNGIDISELERRPDDFTGQNFMYQGKIIQVMEDDPYTAYRVAINDDYDRIAYIQMFSSTLDQRYLDDDYITFYGHYEGLLSYETVIGGESTVPAFTVNGEQIELNEE